MFEPLDPEYAARVRDSYGRQRVMDLIGAELSRLEPGLVEIALPVRPELSQQHGFVHAGIVTTIVDSACGYAAMSLTPAAATVLTVEYKVNFLAPAGGERLLARGVVRKTGRTVSVCAGDVFALSGGQEKLVATMLATVMTIAARPDLPTT